MLRRTRICVLALACVASACVAETGEGSTEGRADGLRGEKGGTYYRVRRDLRLCAFPRCGGYWVEAVNLPATECADGSSADACYVSGLDLDGLGLREGDASELEAALGEVVFRGALEAAVLPDRSGATLAVTEAWRAANDNAPDGAFSKAVDTGIRCVRAPCPSQSISFLNRGGPFPLVDLDLSGVGATEAQLEDARAALADGGLLVAGHHRFVPTGPTRSLRVAATQLYLRVEAQDRCAPMDAQVDGLCLRHFGFAWDGTRCTGLGGCTCEGADCDALYPSLEACEEDRRACVPDPCDGVRCPPGEACHAHDGTGLCVPEPDPCDGVVCDRGHQCREGACVPDRPNPCATVLCRPGTVCEVQDGRPVCVPERTPFPRLPRR